MKPFEYVCVVEGIWTFLIKNRLLIQSWVQVDPWWFLVLSINLLQAYTNHLMCCVIASLCCRLILLVLKRTGYQCCQRNGLPAKMGYFEIACRGSKDCWEGGLKLGYFSSVCPWQLLFSSKFASFLSFQRVFEPFQCLRTFFSSISGIKMSWGAIIIDYPLYAEVNNLIVFQPNWVIFIILRLRSTQIWEIGHMITW